MNSLDKNMPIAPGRLRYDPDTLIAVTWGLAEATLFFIAPDVLLTRIAILRGRRRRSAPAPGPWRERSSGSPWFITPQPPVTRPGWRAGSTGSPASALRSWRKRTTVWRITALSVLWRGAFTGIPFKIYAMHAGAMHLGWMMFLLTSLVACLARFAAASLIAWALARTCSPFLFARLPAGDSRRRVGGALRRLFYPAGRLRSRLDCQSQSAAKMFQVVAVGIPSRPFTYLCG